MNSVNLIGRLTADPEIRRTQEGTPVCSYSLAVKRPHAKDATDFVECVTWRQGAEYLHQYGHRGDVVAVSGNLVSRKWTDKDGNKRTQWEVVTESVELLSAKRNSEASNDQGSQQDFTPIEGDDAQLPF